MVFTNATLFPYVYSPISNITPFTYSDGATYLEQLETLRNWLNESLVPEFNDGIENAINEMNDAMQVVNNKTGQAEIQRFTLAGDFTLEVDPVWPDNNMVNIVLTQNIVGGWELTWGEGIDGSGVTVKQMPGEVTDFWLVPDGDGTWTAINYVLGEELAEAVATINAALALKANASSLATTNTNVTNLTATVTGLSNTKADTTAVTELLTHKAGVVNTLAELKTALLAGGTIRMGNTPITVSEQLDVAVPVRIEGGTFIQPIDAGRPAFNVTTSNVAFEGCVFSGAGTSNNYDENGRFIVANGTSGTYLINIAVNNCHMYGSQSENIRLKYVRDSVITNNRISSFLYSGIMLLSVEDTTVANNTVANAVMKSPVVNVYGIAATDDTNESATRSRNVKITGNTVKNIPWEGIDTHGGDGIVITGNTVESCLRGIALVTGNETRVTVPTNCVVTGNYVDLGTESDNTREGIGLWGISGTGATATITGNTVKGYPTPLRLFYYTPAYTLIEGNSFPHQDWTDIPMDNPSVWGPHTLYPPQYMIDGRTVHIRGYITPQGTQTTAPTRIGTVPPVASPNVLTNYRQTRGANTVSTTSASIVTDVDGTMNMWYRTASNDFYSYPIDGTYARKYDGPRP